MRRKDRQMQDDSEMIAVISRCKVLRLGMAAENRPYVVPLNFGYAFPDGKLTVYFHCARQGKKLDIIRANPAVCLEWDCDHVLTEGETACAYGYCYSSVIAFGKAEIVTAPEEKALGLELLMKHQTGKDFTFTSDDLQNVAVCRITVEEISGKKRLK